MRRRGRCAGSQASAPQLNSLAPAYEAPACELSQAPALAKAPPGTSHGCMSLER